MEDVYFTSLSLFCIVVCLAILNLTIITIDFYPFFFKNKKSTHNPLVESETPGCKLEAERENMSIEDVKAMIENAEAFCDDDELFEAEVRMEEVREAFRVFDEDGDGFVGEGELRRVFCTLGFLESSKAECRKMIRAFDVNKDGKIDFTEFVKLLETSFSCD